MAGIKLTPLSSASQSIFRCLRTPSHTEQQNYQCSPKGGVSEEEETYSCGKTGMWGNNLPLVRERRG